VIAAGIAASALAASPAPAQTPFREDVTVTAAADPLSFDVQSRAVYVLTREQLSRLPVRSVGEALAMLAPLDVRSRGVDGLQSDFSVRGGAFGQTLVLIDGVRLNDAQSGHHNGDIPVVLDDIERIEVLAGPGSSLHGADALGGTIHIITRRERRAARATAGGGSFGTVDVAGGYDWARAAVAGAVARSGGFMEDRDYRTATVTARAAAGAHTMRVAWLDRAFGANGFYGPSPSKEWTSQVLASIERSRLAVGGWRASWRVAGRAHRDRFLWNVARPGVAENRHRSYATTASLLAERPLTASTRVAIGAEAGGDWVTSSNLGDRAYGRGAGFVEMRHQRGRTWVTPAVRYDAYSRFGRAVSPSIAAGRWLGSRVKVRASAGHAFRVPTFTELYYRDPNHEARDTLRPERAWSVEGGADWLPAEDWLLSATTFIRFEHDVIDWVRATPAERWRTTNIREVTTPGLELSARRQLGPGAMLDAQYAFLDSRAPALDLLSKYVLDYARHRVTGAVIASPGGRVTIGTRISHTARVDGRGYTLLDARVGRRVGPFTIAADVRNLLDEDYQEIAGVEMPGRNGRVEIAWGLR
jgi:iron complex outermembrane receptor protein